MSSSGLKAAILRFWAGALAGVLPGFAFFGSDVFQPGELAFQCVTVGALMAVILALVRAGRPTQGLLVVVGFGLLQLGLSWHGGWTHVLRVSVSGLFVAGGLFLVAVIFDDLAEQGYRFFKFFIAGPLLGGIYLAVTPLANWGRFSPMGPLESLFYNLFLGVIIGDGVGFGVELVELVVPGLYSVPIVREKSP